MFKERKDLVNAIFFEKEKCCAIEWEHYEYFLYSLYLDLNNPRLKYRDVNLNQPEILKFLIASKKVFEF